MTEKFKPLYYEIKPLMTTAPSGLMRIIEGHGGDQAILCIGKEQASLSKDNIEVLIFYLAQIRNHMSRAGDGNDG